MKIIKSHELRNLKEVEPKKKKKILFINPKRKDTGFNCPHNGLAGLAAILKKRGHEFLIADYVFMREKNTDVSFFIKKFNPKQDEKILGWKVSQKRVDRINTALFC